MLVANSITLAVSVFAAIVKPILSYRLIAGVALCAFLFALQQVVAARSNPFALLLNFGSRVAKHMIESAKLPTCNS
jgi:hypothetical protein